ncbi:MAG TPA: UvrD-helicase domain-containing protein [Bryobacteraceae bacterium]|nr:UvrD-helicase domain-containing protein [Bryobacteraceae bacterium]
MTPGTLTADQAARERIRHSLNESLLVEASAGTGKTSELVRRIVNVLSHGLTTIDRIVAVTFTIKAAGELKLRLRQELDTARGQCEDPRQAGNLEHALAHLEEAAIGTIHAFCAQILRERPVEACVDPDFEELDEPAAKRVYSGVFLRWIQEKLSHESPGLRRALARLAVREQREQNYTPMECLQHAAAALIDWRDFPVPWERPPLERDRVIDQLVARVKDLDLGRFRSKEIEPVRDMLPWIEREPRDYDMLEGLLFKLYRIWKNNEKQKRLPDPLLFQALTDFRPCAEADLAAQLREELWELVGLYGQAKRRAGQLDFMDLLLLVRDLIRKNTEVRVYLQRKYTHLFVDEFQDTDPLQADILLLLSANDPAQCDMLKITPAPGKLFLVGDPKQAIYRFRRADVQLYQVLRAALESRGVGVVRLSRSFRSVSTLQRCLNAAFAPEMTGDPESCQADFVALEEHRGDIPGQPAVIALPAPRPYGERNVSNKAIDACLPGAVTGFVEWLLRESGWKVMDAEQPEVPIAIRPRHICILFRRFTNWGRDVTRDYVRSLEDRGIPHLLVGSKSFHSREEIDTIRAALTAIEWPEDELALFATLRGAIFAIPDHILLRFRHQYKSLFPFREWPADLLPEYAPVRQALDLLADLHANRNQRPIAETTYLLLEAARAWAAFAFRPAGNQVLANVRRVIDLARHFESSGGISFRGFVEELTRQAERPESAEAPVLEDGAEGIRLMTVHSAKGLEFPVVILADMTANISHESPDRYVEGATGLCAMRLLGCAPLELMEFEKVEQKRDQAEGIRVAYVAATRARDLLVVPVVGDEERKGWISPLNKAVYPLAARHRKSQPAPGCPVFGEASVVNRPAGGFDEISIKPGLHAARAGGHLVVWWDPSILPPGQEEHFGQRQREIFAQDAAATAEGLAEHERWREHRDGLLAEGARPSLTLTLASETAAPPAGWLGEIIVEQTARSSVRPAGKRFGALIHNTLRDVALDASRDQIAAIARLQARLLAAPREEMDAAVLAVRNALRHPMLDRARAAVRCHREYPVTAHIREKEMLEGVIDLAFQENGGWVVVDFKTDAESHQLLARYQAQLAWYAYALQRITGRPVQAFLLAV